MKPLSSVVNQYSIILRCLKPNGTIMKLIKTIAAALVLASLAACVSGGVHGYSDAPDHRPAYLSAPDSSYRQ